MGPITIVFSLLLIALGAWSYLTGTPTPGHDYVSPTAAIPAFAGLPILICGLLALKEGWRKHAMHVAVVLGLLGFLGAAYQLTTLLLNPEATSHMSFDPSNTDGWLNGKKVIVMGGMALLCGVFVALCVRSFIVARIAQRKKAQEAAS